MAGFSGLDPLERHSLAEWTQRLVGPGREVGAFLSDPQVTDILLNGVHSLYVERRGSLERHSSPFQSQGEVNGFVERLLVPSGKHRDAKYPFADGCFGDGSRFHIVFPPAAREGPCISIRKRLGGDVDVTAMAPKAVWEWVSEKIRSRSNLVVAGATGAGKTTLLGWMVEQISHGQRVLLLEETAELLVSHPHTVSLEGRTANADGVGEVSLEALMRNALRMRPDRLVVGECRGAEVFTLLQALNTGHRGSLGTVHANGALAALRRLELLAQLSGPAIPVDGIRRWVADGVDGVLYLEKRGERRALTHVIEVMGLEGDTYRYRPVFDSKKNSDQWSRDQPCAE